MNGRNARQISSVRQWLINYGIRSKMPNTDRWNILKMLTSLKFYSKSIASMSGESSNKTQEAHLTKGIRNSRRSAQRTALP